jgi:hypothetical protein
MFGGCFLECFTVKSGTVYTDRRFREAAAFQKTAIFTLAVRTSNLKIKSHSKFDPPDI